MNDVNRSTAARTGAVALEKAIGYAEDAEHCDASQRYEDRDVRLHFAAVWARIANAAFARELAEKDDPQKRRTTR